MTKGEAKMFFDGNFGELLRRARAATGKSRAGMISGSTTSITKDNIQQWEEGKSLPNINRINEVASIYGISEKDLLIQYQADRKKREEYIEARKKPKTKKLGYKSEPLDTARCGTPPR